MRVIAGSLRGRRIDAPRGVTTRPTSDRVRESLFDLLGPLSAGAAALDLFAGSGALGIEALSRGAARVTFVERDREALAALRRNLEALGMRGRARVVVGDALQASALAPGPWRLILADPPYAGSAAARIVEEASRLLVPGGCLALEHAADVPLPGPPDSLAVWKSRRYGRTRVTLYSRLPEDAS
jgi:16S rRNA (guanine966-N2)-methyltransferase